MSDIITALRDTACHDVLSAIGDALASERALAMLDAKRRELADAQAEVEAAQNAWRSAEHEKGAAMERLGELESQAARLKSAGFSGATREQRKALDALGPELLAARNAASAAQRLPSIRRAKLEMARGRVTQLEDECNALGSFAPVGGELLKTLAGLFRAN